MPMYRGAGGRPPTEYLFVDANSLRMELKSVAAKYWPGEEPPVDWQRLKQHHEKVFFYDAGPTLKEGKEAEFEQQCADHDATVDLVNSLSGFHAYAGETRIREGRRERRIEQKMVDVMIAVDMMRHTFSGNMERCTLLTSDLDFAPLIEALVQAGMWVNLWHGARTNDTLVRRADAGRRMDGMFMASHVVNGDWVERNPLPRAWGASPDFQNYIGTDLDGIFDDGTPYRVFNDLAADGRPTVVFRSTVNRHMDMHNYVQDQDLGRAWLFIEDHYGMKRRP